MFRETTGLNCIGAGLRAPSTATPFPVRRERSRVPHSRSIPELHHPTWRADQPTPGGGYDPRQMHLSWFSRPQWELKRRHTPRSGRMCVAFPTEKNESTPKDPRRPATVLILPAVSGATTSGRFSPYRAGFTRSKSLALRRQVRAMPAEGRPTRYQGHPRHSRPECAADPGIV
jgi:hypothetical protein